MLNGMVNALSGCDIVSPTISLFRSMRNGPSVRFFVPYDLGWSAVQMKKMLESKGVIVWGLTVAGEDITFQVRETQARYAAYWLQRHRLPFESTSKESLNGKGPSGTDGTGGGRQENAKNGKPGKTGKQGMFDGVLDRIDGMVDSL